MTWRGALMKEKEGISFRPWGVVTVSTCTRTTLEWTVISMNEWGTFTKLHETYRWCGICNKVLKAGVERFDRLCKCTATVQPKMGPAEFFVANPSYIALLPFCYWIWLWLIVNRYTTIGVFPKRSKNENQQGNNECNLEGFDTWMMLRAYWLEGVRKVSKSKSAPEILRNSGEKSKKWNEMRVRRGIQWKRVEDKLH